MAKLDILADGNAAIEQKIAIQGIPADKTVAIKQNNGNIRHPNWWNCSYRTEQLLANGTAAIEQNNAI